MARVFKWLALLPTIDEGATDSEPTGRKGRRAK